MEIHVRMTLINLCHQRFKLPMEPFANGKLLKLYLTSFQSIVDMVAEENIATVQSKSKVLINGKRWHYNYTIIRVFRNHTLKMHIPWWSISTLQEVIVLPNSIHSVLLRWDRLMTELTNNSRSELTQYNQEPLCQTKGVSKLVATAYDRCQGCC